MKTLSITLFSGLPLLKFLSSIKFGLESHGMLYMCVMSDGHQSGNELMIQSCGKIDRPTQKFVSMYLSKIGIQSFRHTSNLQPVSTDLTHNVMTILTRPVILMHRLCLVQEIFILKYFFVINFSSFKKLISLY